MNKVKTKEERVKQYCRFTKANHSFVKKEAKKMDISQNQMVNIIINQAREKTQTAS